MTILQIQVYKDTLHQTTTDTLKTGQTLSVEKSQQSKLILPTLVIIAVTAIIFILFNLRSRPT